MIKRFKYDWNKIRAALEQEARDKKMTEQMLAQEIGIAQSLYSMFMRGKRPTIGRESLIKICMYFDVPHEHWLKEVPVKEEEQLLLQLELLLTKNENLPAEQRGVLKSIKNQIEDLYKGVR